MWTVKRLRNLWELSRYETGIVDRAASLLQSVEEHKEKNPSSEIIEQILAAETGVGEFLPDMTDEEVLEYERNERLGWKNYKLPWQKKNQ